MRIPTATTLASAILILAPAFAPAADLPASTKRGMELMKEGDGLADRMDTTEAVLRYKLAFEQLLPGLRRLPFKSEVKRDVTAREDLKAFLLKELDEDQTPAEFKAGELALKAFGLIGRDLNWKEVMVRVYSEEIAAFYDPKTKTMHLIREPGKAEAKKPSLLESLMGKKGGFDKDENKTVIAHELTHALADQHYNLDKMQDAIDNDDDRSMALSSLIEGEATLAMIGAQMDDWDGSKVTAMPAADLDRLFSLMLPFMSMSGGQALREAPPILSDSLIFPYFRGMVFCASLANDGGWASVDAAYKSPPQSTEQIIHPEKYRGAEVDPPTSIDLGKLDPGAGWAEAGRNTLGEMQLGVLLRRHGGKPIAAGWDGDRYAVFEGPEGKLGLAWLTTWDTEDDARDFARQYARYQTTLMGEGIESPAAFPDTLRRPHAGTVYAVERRGTDVVVVQGFVSDVTENLVEAAFRAKKVEMPAAK